MGFRRKTEDLNKKPFNPNVSPEQKAKEFDQQYGQNRTYNPSVTPNLDAYEGKEPKKGRHRK